MKEYAAKPNPHRCPTHPGELLREDILPAIGSRQVCVGAGVGDFAPAFVRHPE